MSSLSDTTYQEVGQPLAVGLVSTEGEKLLNALRKIQTKLSDGHNRRERSAKKSVTTALTTAPDTNGHHLCCAHGSGDQHSRRDLNRDDEKTSEDVNNKLIETRLKIIETQLKNISMQLSANTCAGHQTNNRKTEHKKSSPSKPRSVTSDNEDNRRINDKYELSIEAIRQMIKTDGDHKVPKSVSLDRIDKQTNDRKHFRLQYKDIPFILGTNTSKSHSVIVNRQIELSRLKQHNRLCNQTSGQSGSRRVMSQSIKNKLLDNEIKDLLYDLEEEHNYICEEIQYLTKQLERVSDPQRRSDFNRELYFLSRRILAKKRQINELKELHAIVRQNANRDTNRETIVDNKVWRQRYEKCSLRKK